MKLPLSKEDIEKGMMMSGTSTGRKGVLCERWETSLVGGYADRGVQFTSMDLGSGDTSDYYADIQNNYDSFNWDTRFETHDFRPAHSTITKTHILETTSTSLQPPLPPPTPPISKVLSSSAESLNKRTSSEKLNDERSDAENFFNGKENQTAESKNATSAMVEDRKQPSFTANESNPTVPAPTETSKTSTLRLSDRTRSESEDDIEKMDDPEQDETIIGNKKLFKTTTTTENSTNSEKMDKNGNRPDLDQNETDNECVVQCLYYTIQCCECVIF